MIGSILLVLALGGATRGSKRWIDFPFFRFQPSELGKLLLVLAVSAFVVDRIRRLQDRDTTARVMLMALVPSVLVMLQPDLGSAIVYVVIALAILFVAGTSWKHFAALFALFAISLTLVLVAAPAVGVHVLKPYQTDRLTAFLNPSDNPADQGYQQNQSRIAIGSGQKSGRPHPTQTTLNFLPEHHTDFIFAVVGERYGFAGAALVLSLYALLIWRGLRILTMAKNLYGALIAGGIVAMLLWQVFVNVGMTIGIMPITGVPLPLDVLRRLFGPRDLPVRRDPPVDLRPRSPRRQGSRPRPRIRMRSPMTHRSAAPTRTDTARKRPRTHALRRRLPLRKQVLVSVDHGETRVALLEATGKPAAQGSRRRRKPQNPAAGYHVAELYIERRGARSIVGNIYKGRVDNVLPGLEAAFVDIGLDKNGFLHVDEIVLPGVEVPRRGRAAGARSPTCSSPARRSWCRWSRTR